MSQLKRNLTIITCQQTKDELAKTKLMLDGINSRYNQIFNISIFDLKFLYPDDLDSNSICIIFGEKALTLLKAKFTSFNPEQYLLVSNIKLFWDNAEQKKDTWLKIKAYLDKRLQNSKEVEVRSFSDQELESIVNKAKESIQKIQNSQTGLKVFTKTKVIEVVPEVNSDNQISYEELFSSYAASLLFDVKKVEYVNN